MSGHRWRHSWDDPLETGLVVVVPEADERVGRVRDGFDPYAGIGVPPHITVLYPFVRPDRLSEAVIHEVARAAGRFAPFGFALTHLGEFDGEVFYLAPEPADPFVTITRALWERFPDNPPFGGRFETIVPHRRSRACRSVRRGRRSKISSETTSRSPRRRPVSRS
jgi:hypothetical protein